MKIQNIEDAAEVVVGRTYLVNTVETLKGSVWGAHRAPILGTLHEDRDVIGFLPDHIHVDWRFVSHAKYEHVAKNVQLQKDAQNLPGFTLLSLPLSVNYTLANEYRTGDKQPERRALECKRLFDVWPETVPWMADLERAYQAKRAMVGRNGCRDICPHRGISLVGAPEDPGIPGSRVCPGHGLCFDRETGVLRPRAMIKGSRVTSEDVKRTLRNADSGGW